MRIEIKEIEYCYIDEIIIVKEQGQIFADDKLVDGYKARVALNYWRQDANKQNIDRQGMSFTLLESATPITDDQIIAELTVRLPEFRDMVKKQVADYPPTIIKETL